MIKSRIKGKLVDVRKVMKTIYLMMDNVDTPLIFCFIEFILL